MRKQEQERLCKIREEENNGLEEMVKQLRSEVAFLTRVLRNPGILDPNERTLLDSLLRAESTDTGKGSSSNGTQ